MKYIIVVPDGMYDHPQEELGQKTPMEMANTTNMDYLAKNGFSGLVQTIPNGMPPGSDIGNMSILGYDPHRYHTGRAPLEAASQDIDIADDEVIFRCNFVTAEGGKMVDHSAGHISSQEADILIDALNHELADDAIQFYPGKSYRNLLVLKARGTQKFLNIKTTPPHDILGKGYKPFLPKGPEAEVLLRLMEKSTSIFQQHNINQVRVDLKENPASMIWLWGQGTKPKLEPFKAKFGLNGGIISAVDLVLGLGKLAGLEIIDVPGITGYYDTNYLGKAQYALKALERLDFVYIHIEAPDEAGHNGDARAKIEAIEHVDREIIGTILNYFENFEDFRILVLPDHPTPLELRTHSHEPVGFVMYGHNIMHDGAEEYNEKALEGLGIKFNSAFALTEYFLKSHL